MLTALRVWQDMYKIKEGSINNLQELYDLVDCAGDELEGQDILQQCTPAQRLDLVHALHYWLDGDSTSHEEDNIRVLIDLMNNTPYSPRPDSKENAFVSIPLPMAFLDNIHLALWDAKERLGKGTAYIKSILNILESDFNCETPAEYIRNDEEVE